MDWLTDHTLELAADGTFTFTSCTVVGSEDSTTTSAGTWSAEQSEAGTALLLESDDLQIEGFYYVEDAALGGDNPWIRVE